MIESRILDAKEAAKHNAFFRKVLFTADKSQLVVMSLFPAKRSAPKPITSISSYTR